jgi:NitT/TauT family transport system permease protein
LESGVTASATSDSKRTTITDGPAETASPGPDRHRLVDRFRGGWRASWPALLVAALGVAGWELVVRLFDIEAYLLPSPGAVISAAFNFAEHDWAPNILVTTWEIVGGFGLAAVGGVALGTAIAWSVFARRALVPLLVFLNTLPKVALAPMFLFWLGYGVLPNAVIAALIAFFPIVVTTSVGLSQIDPDLVDLGRSMRAPTWRVFAMIRFPNALPYIFSSLKVGVTMAVVGAVVGEFIAAQSGLGYVITAVQTSLSTAVALAAMFWISVIGLVLYGLVDLVGKLVAPWAQSVDS